MLWGGVATAPTDCWHKSASWVQVAFGSTNFAHIERSLSFDLASLSELPPAWGRMNFVPTTVVWLRVIALYWPCTSKTLSQSITPWSVQRSPDVCKSLLCFPGSFRIISSLPVLPSIPDFKIKMLAGCTGISHVCSFPLWQIGTTDANLLIFIYLFGRME